jgi:hypothetical protein
MLQAMRPLARRKSSGLGLIAKLHARIVEIGWTSCRAAGKWWRAPSGLRRCFGQHWAELVPSIAAQDDRTICRRVLCYSLDRFSRRAMRAKPANFVATAEADGTCVQYPSTVFEPCCTGEDYGPVWLQSGLFIPLPLRFGLVDSDRLRMVVLHRR